MTHSAPMQNKRTGKWYYARGTRDGSCLLGYCAQEEACPECLGWCREKHVECRNCNSTGFLPVENPCQGHDTADEACDHYRQYLIDHVKYNCSDKNNMKRCKICGEFTQKFAQTSDAYPRMFVLCEAHNNRESVSALMPEVGESWES